MNNCSPTYNLREENGLIKNCAWAENKEELGRYAAILWAIRGVREGVKISHGTCERHGESFIE